MVLPQMKFLGHGQDLGAIGNAPYENVLDHYIVVLLLVTNV